jgi:CRISPR system Cascade subunit CasC
MIVVREGQPVSLVDAFEDPVSPKNAKGLLANAVSQLDTHWNDLKMMYGSKGVKFAGIVTRSQFSSSLNSLASIKKESIEQLVTEAIVATFEMNGGQ